MKECFKEAGVAGGGHGTKGNVDYGDSKTLLQRTYCIHTTV